jgi:hypothetical protein
MANELKFTMIKPTHRCNVCGAYWKKWKDAWSLTSTYCGMCCNMTSMPSVYPLIDFDEDGKEIL